MLFSFGFVLEVETGFHLMATDFFVTVDKEVRKKMPPF